MVDVEDGDGGVVLFGRPPPRRAPSPRRRPRQAPPPLNVPHNDDTKDNAVENRPLLGSNSEASSSFAALGLSEWLSQVCASLGMVTPTTVQRGCIPAVLGGKDVVGVAETGSGKTAAFALPILQRLARDPYGVFALVLTPTRELAIQLEDQFKALGAGMSLKTLVVIGGLDMQMQAKQLARRPHVVIATPGRLSQLFELDDTLGKGFSRAAFLVLDEADRVLEPSFEAELTNILTYLPAKRQTLLFSATMTRALLTLRNQLLKDAFYFETHEESSKLHTAGPNLREEYLLVPAKVKEVYLFFLLQKLEEFKVRSAIIFSSTCRGCALLSALLSELSIQCTALHSHLPQRRRMASLDRFRNGIVPILLATDVASRGLDIPTVDLVVNFDLPLLARDYVHRVGRTARAGRRGWTLSFVSQYDVELVNTIEDLTGKKMEACSKELEESQVLKNMTLVYSARRKALMKIDEDKTSIDTKKRRRVKER